MSDKAQMAGEIERLEAERKRLEQALCESDTRLQALFSHMVNGFALHEVICDDKGKVVDFIYLDVNPAFEQMTGLTRDHLVGHRLTDIMPDAERYWIDSLAEVAITRVPKYFENYSRHNGKWIATHSYYTAPGQFAAVVEDISERKLVEKKIQHLAYHDVLTGLPNRSLARDRFDQACVSADRVNNKVALLFLDLDNFKSVNDSLGHTIGDELLKIVVARLNKCVRTTDTISRQGGDEFMIVLPDLPDADAAAPILLKIREHLHAPFDIDGNELTTSVSIGIAIYPDDGSSFDILLKKADMAMYRAKDSGRNAYQFFNEQMNADVMEHLAMRTGLRKALERSELVLHYQPQIDLTSGAMVGAEALVRWNHPEFGLVAPGRFIHVAEDCGLIVPIGEWVMHEACRQAKAWSLAGLPEFVIAVNLSAVQFKRSDVEQVVVNALDESGLNPLLLELELTESIMLHNVENVMNTMKRLKMLGVRLSIDDFGTGYSSLSYLKRLAVDKLKIDQSFIRDLAADSENEAIVRAIIQLAKSLNLKTIAEGVEDATMLTHLLNFDCDEAQGYHFARPMPAHEFEKYLSCFKAVPR